MFDSYLGIIDQRLRRGSCGRRVEGVEVNERAVRFASGASFVSLPTNSFILLLSRRVPSLQWSSTSSYVVSTISNSRTAYALCLTVLVVFLVCRWSHLVSRPLLSLPRASPLMLGLKRAHD